MKVLTKRNCIIILIVLCLFMIIGSFYDYPISLALYNQKNPFGIFFASYGQLPAMLCSGVGGLLLMRVYHHDKRIKRVLSIVFGILLQVMAVIGIAVDPVLYMHIPMAVSCIIALVIVGSVDITILKMTKDASIDMMKKVMWLFIGTMFIELIVINIVKILWARPRMRMITAMNVDFQPWWVIGSEMKDSLMALGVVSEEFKSFPSGHTGNAACMMLLSALPLICSSLKGKESLLFVVGIIFTLLVAFSRIIMGAHFLTDVTVGMTVTFVVMNIMNQLIFKRTYFY